MNRCWAGLIAVVAASVAGCDSVTAADGHVVDAAGRPVPRALVVLARAGDPVSARAGVTHADTAGQFAAVLHGGLGSSDAVLAVFAPGVGRAERRVPDGVQWSDLRVTLAPARPGTPSCASPPGATVIQ